MKNTKKSRALSILLAIVMIVSLIPIGTISVNAMGLSTFNSKVASFKSNRYPHGSTYVNNASYGGYQCFGFANEIATYIFGSFPTSSMSASSVNSGWTRTYGGSAVDNLRVGDVVRYHFHSIFITAINGNDIEYCQANVPNGTNKVTYGNHITRSELKSLVSDKLTSGGTDKTGWVAHFKNGVNDLGPHTHSYSGSYFEAEHPHKVYEKCSCGKTRYTGATRAYQNCSICMHWDSAYVQPVKAYTINTGKTTVYDSVNGKAKINKIYDSDLCTINQIYDCGWCKVSFPLTSGGTETGYCKISVFMKSGGYIMYASKKIDTYRRSDLKTSCGYVGAGDKIYILGTAGSAVQIAYPLSSGGWKVGWIPISAIKSTIAYNANGGSGSMPSSTVVLNGSFTPAANKFTRVGYTFSGWNVYRNSDKKWYVDDKGWLTESEISKNKYKKRLYNSSSLNFDKSWNNLGKSNDIYTMYAVWTPNKLNVNFNANGGKINSDTYKLSNNLVYKIAENEKCTQVWTYNQPNKNGLSNASTFGLSKEGYTFKGWGTSMSGGTVFDDNDVNLVPESINPAIKKGNCSSTVYAIWKANTYTVTYNANGGTGATASSSHTYDTAKALTANGFTRSGYTFLGWSTSPNATTATYTNKQSVKNLTATNGGTVTLYAVWQKNPVTVSSISVQSNPSKTVYTVGETFSSSGLSIKVNMSDGTSKTVTSGFTVSSPDMTTAGTKAATVTYQGKTTIFYITVNKPVSPTSAKYKISGASATAGSTVEVFVSIENNPGIISLRNKISYDTSVMELVKVEDLKLLAGYTTPAPTISSPYVLRWADALATQNNTANGNFVKLTFKIKDSASAGDYKISVSHIESKTATGEAVEFADSSAVIEVMDYMIGDIDNNGDINDWDAIALNRYLAGWQTEVNIAAADMNGDGEITDWDAISLERRLAGWKS